MTALKSLRLRVAMTAYVLRKLAPPLLVIFAYTLVATVVVRWDLARSERAMGDFQSTAYGLYTQLFFEPTAAFPSTTVSRIIFWITPAIGAVLVAQGLFKVGASLLDLATRREVWVTLMGKEMRDHVVVCGIGHVGYRVLEELSALGAEVIAIERSDGDFAVAARAAGLPVKIGDARIDAILEEVGVPRAKAVVCATDDDLANLEIALDAKRMNPSIRVVMRMFDQRLAEKVGGALDLEQSFSSAALSAPLVAMQATERGVRGAYRLDGALRVTAEARVGASAAGLKVVELEERADCRIVSQRREGEAFRNVRGRDEVAKGDIVIVDALAVELAAVRARIGA